MKKTSPSAQGVAYLRSLEEDLSGDTLAKYFVAEDGVALANEWLKLYPGVGREICIRNRYIEDKISEYINDRGINQVMNIAAGLNTFPYRHPDSFGLQRYAELDLPKMIDFKKEFISRLVDDGVIEKLHPSVQYVPIDLLSDELEFNVEGWDWNRPTMFILEGISYYVPFDKLKNIINKLSQLSSKGSVIVMDYFLKNASKKKVFDKIMSTIS
ncbi:class I SAM-dependent methyltransferase, partial [bacterium]|nr:class I SAM-dependent methyltransferase [bacterium]